MPEDMSPSAEILRIDGQPSANGAEAKGSLVDQQERACDFGCCTFVLDWYRKINARTAANSSLQSESCPKCHGVFSHSSSLLPAIVLGGKDKMGQTIMEIYVCGEDYAIYRSRQGVYIHFADCRVRERQQRANYVEISQKLCRLRFLISQMARWLFAHSRFVKNGGFYDHQIAEALHLALQGKSNEANQILDSGLALAEERITNENRVRYLLACLLIALIPSGAVWALYRSDQIITGQIWVPYLIAAAAGATGAVFSITSRIQDLELKPVAQSVMNYIMGALRVLTGFVAGAIILFIINGTVFGEGVIKIFEAPSMTELTARSWKCIVLVGFLGGFAERLVPSLLKNLQSRVENRPTDEQRGAAPDKEVPNSPNS